MYRLAKHSKTGILFAAYLSLVGMSSTSPGEDTQTSDPSSQISSRRRAHRGDLDRPEREQRPAAIGDLSDYISVARSAIRAKPIIPPSLPDNRHATKEVAPRAFRVPPSITLDQTATVDSPATVPRSPSTEEGLKSHSGATIRVPKQTAARLGKGLVSAPTRKFAVVRASALQSIPDAEFNRLRTGIQTRPERPLKPTQRTATIQLKTATAHRLLLREEIGHVEVVDRQVCVVLKSGARELNLIAKRKGETAVTVHYETGRAAETYWISVGTGNVEQSTATGEQQVETLIAEMFPRSDVTLIPQEETLLVSGVVRSDREAVRILSFVRSLLLIPVVDQLKVQR